MTLRIYLRRSKGDADHQQFSLDVQREGCRAFVVDELPGRGVRCSWASRKEFIDDDRAGDDFLGREGLRRLLAEAQRGDVVVTRDQSRLGRDALETTLAIRDLVRDHGTRLYYYASRMEVPFASAIDAATTFIQGTGHQMELEAIRSRTREALRARVRAGRIAGGKCYGFNLRRERDASGREFTVAVVDERQAEVVRRIYREYLDGWGIKLIAAGLNRDRIAPPWAGRRGTGSWAPSAVRTILMNARYIGVYVHGVRDRVRIGGKRVARAADPAKVLRVEVPAWRIVDDATWYRAQEIRSKRGGNVHSPGPACKHALSSVGRCGVCGGPIGAGRNTKTKEGVLVPAYGCTYHRDRGTAVCGVSLIQPAEEVENALADYVQTKLLTDKVLAAVLAEIRAEVARQLATPDPDTSGIETELASLRIEQRRLAAAVAQADDVPELIAELRRRSERIRHLETELAVMGRTPKMRAELAAKVEQAAVGRLGDLRTALAGDPAGAREVYRALFPEGLRFLPAQGAGRKAWRVEGVARLDSAFGLRSDPTGSRPNPKLVRPVSLVLLRAA